MHRTPVLSLSRILPALPHFLVRTQHFQCKFQQVYHFRRAGAKFDPRFQRVFNARGIAQKLVLALEPLKW